METEILPYLAIGISVVGTVLGYINHKRIRSTCCGVERIISVDVESTTPPTRVSRVEPEVGYRANTDSV